MDFKEKVQKLNSTQDTATVKKKGLIQVKNELSGQESKLFLSEEGNILQSVDKVVTMDLDKVTVVRDGFIASGDLVYEILNWKQLSEIEGGGVTHESRTSSSKGSSVQG